MLPLNPDFADCLRALSEADARYLIVGGYALSVHAAPRATGDLDIWVEPSETNAERVYRALDTFGAPLSDLSVEDLRTPEIVFQMGVPPRRIDVLTSVSGLDFATSWAGRTTLQVADVTVFVIGRDELIVNKRAAGRTQDLADVESLERHRPRDG